MITCPDCKQEIKMGQWVIADKVNGFNLPLAHRYCQDDPNRVARNAMRRGGSSFELTPERLERWWAMVKREENFSEDDTPPLA